MDATRAEVERELKRIRGCIESVQFRMTQHKNEIKRLARGNFDASSVQNKAEWLKQCEWEGHQYRYVERILFGILERTQPPAVEEVQRATGWQPIETAPAEHVLLYYPAETGRFPCDELVAIGFGRAEFLRKPTHWMPLPKPPAVEGET